MNKEQNIEANGDSLKLLFNCTVDYLKEKQIVVDGISNFTQLGQTIFHIREKVLSTISELDFYENFDEEIEPTLMQLLSTRCFRTVLTTCIDPYLEIAMEKVMACSIGVCKGCVIKIKKDGKIQNATVCHDGPVFDGGDVVWQ